MKIGKDWRKVIPELTESYPKLEERERNAVGIALRGIRQWQITGEKPKLIRAQVTSENPFNLKSFAQVMHEMEIGITNEMKKEGEDTITFQPRPYSRTFMPETDAGKLEAVRETIVIMIPPEIMELLRRYGSSE